VEKAIEYHEKALAIAKEIGDRRGEGGLLGNLGQTYSDLGQVEKAIEYSEKALVIKHEIGDSYGEATHLAILGHSLILQNKLEKAIREYDKAVSIAEETKNRQNQNEARYGQALSGVIALRMDETKAAKDAFISAIAKADEMLTKSKNNFSALYAKGLALSGLALCDGGKSRVDEAISAYKAACKINGYAGVIKRALLLFEELVKINEVGMLADVRDFLQSNQ
jgi:tetratricopeptide (TPR) repeat protein